MDALDQILTGMQDAFWLLSWALPVPLDPEAGHVQVAMGGLVALGIAGWLTVRTL